MAPRSLSPWIVRRLPALALPLWLSACGDAADGARRDDTPAGAPSAPPAGGSPATPPGDDAPRGDSPAGDPPHDAPDGDTPHDDAPDGDAPGGDSPSSDAAALPETSPACATGTWTPTGPVTFSRGGVSGSYLLHVPPAPPGMPLPVVVNLHGQPGTGAIQEVSSAMSPIADAKPFAVVYPDAVGQGWASGGFFAGGGRDDVAFLDALLDDVGERVCIAPRRVYATGHSAGGFMTYRLACDLAHRFAAVAPVAGAFVVDPSTCHPSRPLPMLHVHGTADPRVPYDASSPAVQPPGVQIVPGRQSVAAYAARIGCGATTHVTLTHADWRCETFDACPAGTEVTFCSVEGMGHPWPGGDPGAGYGWIGGAIVGPASSTLNAGDLIWDTFFTKFTL